MALAVVAPAWAAMSAANLCAYGVHTLLQSDLLIHSAARGDAARVAKLLRRCEWVNRKTLRTGDTALSLAASRGHVAVMRLLLAAHADSGTRNKLGNTPLHLAVAGRRRRGGAFLASDGHAECVEELLEPWWHGGGLVNAQNNAGDTVLHCCARSGDECIARMLLDATCSADMDAVNKEGFTPLHVAALENDVPFMSLLLERGASICITSKDGRCALSCCSHESLAALEAGVLRKWRPDYAPPLPLSTRSG